MTFVERSMLSDRVLPYLSVPPQQQSSMKPFEPLQLAITAGSMQAIAARPTVSVLACIMDYLRLEISDWLEYRNRPLRLSKMLGSKIDVSRNWK